MDQIFPEQISDSIGQKVFGGMRLFCSTSVRARQFNSPSSSNENLAVQISVRFGPINRVQEFVRGLRRAVSTPKIR